MSTPAAKRRRIDAAQALSKPFRSPFKTPFKSPDKDTSMVTPPENSATKSATLTTNPTALISKNPNTLPPSTKTPSLSRNKPKLPPTTTHLPRPGTKSIGRKFTSPIVTTQLNADPEIVPLVKAQRELEKTLREVKEELDAAEQAWKIEEASRKWDGKGGKEQGQELDGELLELCRKWKGASREAAEELFGRVRERVNRMGGPRAWKEAQKRQQEFHNSWDNESTSNNKNDDENEDDGGDGKDIRDFEKRNVYAEYGIDPETENEKAQRQGRMDDNGERPGEEDEFTMAMMLRTLNVDLDSIGYDREGQRWID